MIDHCDDSLFVTEKITKNYSACFILNIYKTLSAPLTDGPVRREVPESAMAEQPLAQYPE